MAAIGSTPSGPELTEADLAFVVGEAAPGAANKDKLRQLARDDEDFRKALLGDDKVFERVVGNEEALVKISPALYFEVLLRRVLKELELATHTVERAGRESIPVFDTGAVVELLNQPAVLHYLAQMLASFTQIHSYVVAVRAKPGIQQRIRYNDMDIDSLLRICAATDEEERLGFYRRIADVCLFVSGIFADYALRASGQVAMHSRVTSSRWTRRTLGDYETEGRRFYGLAERHPAAKALELSEVFGLLKRHFTSARKPLAFVAGQYLHLGKHRLFGLQAG